jgi:hypothetical protein
MNKRIKKKNDFVRINDMLIKGMDLIDDYMLIYARLTGYENCHDNDNDFWNGYDKWNKSNSGRRTWNYILKKNNLPKHRL